MRTYQTASRDELGCLAEEWQALQEFLTDAAIQFQESQLSDEITEAPPQIITDSSGTKVFDPNGWIGMYPGGVRVVPGKLTTDETEYLCSAIAGWLETWNVPTASVVLPLFDDRTLDRRGLVLGYSQALIEITETVLATNLPVSVDLTYKQERRPSGPIDVQRTVQQRAQGSQQVTSRQFEFSVDTLPNRLLVRFHATLARALDELRAESHILDQPLSEHHEYHTRFIESGSPATLLDASLEMTFADPTVLAQTRDAASAELATLVPLWEGYLADRSLDVDFSEQVTLGVKPMSRLYELWVLRVLLSSLTEITGTKPTRSGEKLRSFAYPDGLTLHFDTPLSEFSRFLAHEIDVHPGRPDFALSIDDTVVWVGDAKFRHRRTIGTSDYQRLMSYMLDLIPGDARAAIFYVGSAETRDRVAKHDDTIDHLALRPAKREPQQTTIETVLEELLAEY